MCLLSILTNTIDYSPACPEQPWVCPMMQCVSTEEFVLNLKKQAVMPNTLNAAGEMLPSIHPMGNNWEETHIPVYQWDQHTLV